MRHDRGPEFTGALVKVEIVPIPGVDHGATSEGVKNKVQVGTRRARLTAGFPVELWLIVMQGFCFRVGWWFDVMRDPADDVRKRLKGDFMPIPIDVRVAY